MQYREANHFLCQSLPSPFLRVSSIESKSSHPMAAALVDHGRSLSIDPKPENVDDFQNFPGEGVHGRIDGKDIYIGNRKIATRANCATGWIFHKCFIITFCFGGEQTSTIFLLSS